MRFPLELWSWPSLEAQVAAISDDIAYDNHDIDDGLRAGFLDLDELLSQEIVASQWREVEPRFPRAPMDRKLRELIRSQIGLMVNDVIAETKARVAGLASPDDVRSAGRISACFSEGLEGMERTFKRFMYSRLYNHPVQLEVAERAKTVIAELFAAFTQEPVLMDEEWIASMPKVEPERSRHIADYIAGMTDRYAISCHARIYGRTPEWLRNV